MTTTEIKVTGMTCGHCVRAVTEELSALKGVTGVHVHLVPGEVSAVTVDGESELRQSDIAAAVDEAGYQLVDAAG